MKYTKENIYGVKFRFSDQEYSVGVPREDWNVPIYIHSENRIVIHTIRRTVNKLNLKVWKPIGIKSYYDNYEIF